MVIPGGQNVSKQCLNCMMLFVLTTSEVLIHITQFLQRIRPVSYTHLKVTSIDEINSFAKLKEVADDIQSRLAEVSEAAGPEYDLKGAFTSAGMDSSSDWRFKTHLANLPIYYEYKADGIGSTDAIKGTCLLYTS